MGRVLRILDEGGEGAVPDVHPIGEDGDGSSVVVVDELAVGVAGGDVEAEPGGELPGAGDIERCEAEAGDVEYRAVGAVDEVEHARGDGGKENEDDEDEREPEAAGATAAPPAAPGRRSLADLGPIGGKRGAVRLPLGRRERRRHPVRGLRRRRDGLRRRVHTILHYPLLSGSTADTSSSL